MFVTAIFRAYSRSREATEAFALANEYEFEKQGEAAERHYRRGVVALRMLADTLGYELKRKQMPQAPRVKKARDVEPGDKIVGYFEVGDVSHGPLDGQIRFRDANETATVFFSEAEELQIEVRS